MKRHGQEPVAVVGIGCRFPGTDQVGARRWDEAARAADWLAEIAQFDAGFFGISPREAARMDPQQRLLLEVAWEALEDAGVVPQQLAGSGAGVFVGLSRNDYARPQLQAPESVDAYTATGNALSIAANRLSYFFDLRGPSLAANAGGVSPLAAIHLACESIRAKESTIALAGGASLTPFAAEADARDGVAILVLKPLAAALADGDFIHATILASRMQRRKGADPLAGLLDEVCHGAGLSPRQVGQVEVASGGDALAGLVRAVLTVGHGRGDGGYVGVAALGERGANALVVLGAHRGAAAAVSRAQMGAELLVLSGRSADALRQSARELVSFLRSGGLGTCSFGDLCYTAGVRREQHAHRLTLLAAGPEEAVACLEGFLRGEGEAAIGRKVPGREPRVALLFPERAVSAWESAPDWLEEPACCQTFAACSSAFAACVGVGLADALRGRDDLPLSRAGVLRLVSFCLQLSLGVLWRSWGITPAAVLGSGLGELAAAHAAGEISLVDAVKAAHARCVSEGSAVLAAACVPPDGHDFVIDCSPAGVTRADLLQMLGALHVGGVEVAWASVWPTGRLVPLPHYPWQHTRYWIEASLADEAAADVVPTAPGVAASVPGAAGLVADAASGPTGVAAAAPGAAALAGPEEPITREQLRALPLEERCSQLAGYLCRSIARLLAADPASLDPLVSLTRFGLDSIMAIDLKNRMERQFGLTIPMTRILEGITYPQLAALLAAQLDEAAAPVASEESGPASALSVGQAERLLEQIEHLSDEEVERMLELLAK